MIILGKNSMLNKLVGDLFRKDAWNDGNIGDLQNYLRLVANASITLAGIALATVAFFSNQFTDNSHLTENLVSVVMILLSVVFLFWSFGFALHAVLAIKRENKFRLTIAASNLTYYFAGIGLFLFFGGLIWSVSVINPLFSIIAAIGYFVIAGMLFMVGRKLELSEVGDTMKIGSPHLSPTMT
jgi:hypothetical protein